MNSVQMTNAQFVTLLASSLSEKEKEEKRLRISNGISICGELKEMTLLILKPHPRVIFENKYPSLQEVEERLVLEGVIYKNKKVLDYLVQKKIDIENDNLYSFRKDAVEGRNLNFTLDQETFNNLYTLWKRAVNCRQNGDPYNKDKYDYLYTAKLKKAIFPKLHAYGQELQNTFNVELSKIKKIITDMYENTADRYEEQFMELVDLEEFKNQMETLEDIRYLFE